MSALAMLLAAALLGVPLVSLVDARGVAQHPFVRLVVEVMVLAVLPVDAQQDVLLDAATVGLVVLHADVLLDALHA